MQCYQESYRFYNENEYLKMGVYSTIGNRSEQQDCTGFEITKDEALMVICDGMGGHAGGQLASRLATSLFLDNYSVQHPCKDPHQYLINTAFEADFAIAAIKDENGRLMHAGTTVASILIQKQQLYWFSAGDSRIYLYRNGELVQATIDHNYGFVLRKKFERGEISKELLEQEARKSETLVSFLGVNGLPFFCSNDTPFELRSGDMVLLTTDGMYRALSDNNIEQILQNFVNIPDALLALESRVSSCTRNQIRDNMTVSIIKVI